MKSEEIKTLFEKFEAIACEYQGVECWSARDLSTLLGYTKWERFQNAIDKAMEACKNAGEIVENHFPGAGKMVSLGSGSVREVSDYMLTRYACYLIAQNGDSRKPEISFAQNYFAVQTRVAEIVEGRIRELERVQAVDPAMALAGPTIPKRCFLEYCLNVEWIARALLSSAPRATKRCSTLIRIS